MPLKLMFTEMAANNYKCGPASASCMSYRELRGKARLMAAACVSENLINNSHETFMAKRKNRRAR